MGDSSVTTSINHYDGIFKFLHTEQAKEPFLQARKYLAAGKWALAERTFLEAKQKCNGNEEDVKTVELVIRKMQRYKQSEIADNTPVLDHVKWEKVRERPLKKFEEEHDVLPQGVFVLRLPSTSDSGHVQVLGRKTLSHLWIEDKIPEIFCSQIRADMFLGLLVDWRITDSKDILFYHSITPSEALAVYHQVASTQDNNAELVFPFPLLKTVSRREFTSPLDGWDVDPNFDHTLSHGETHIRDFTITTLRRLGFTAHRLYDPACSTGVFLSTLKKAFPACTTIGQDLSKQMCDVAKARVDEVHCGNAMEPKIPPGSADVVFNRFLNSEVVTSAAAEKLLAALLPTVAKGGVMITFGHTPVLLSSSHFKMIDGFELLSCVGVANDSSSIFQYFVIKRIKENIECLF